MSFTRKLFSILVTIAILFGSFIFKPTPAKAIKNFIVEVTPKVVGEVAEYKFNFTVEKELQVHDRITLLFPSGVVVPEIPDWHNKKNMDKVREMLESIEMNGQKYFTCGGLPSILRLSDGSVEFSITSIYRYIPGSNDHDKVEITFMPKFGIMNPSKAGSYVFKVKNNREQTYVESQLVEITEKTKEEDKPELPDSLNANVWFSNPVKGQVTNMLVHIPLEVKELCCFELRLIIPMDILDVTSYFSKENITKENQEFFLNHVFLNGKPLKESTASASRISSILENGKLYLEIVPLEKNVKQLDFLFDKALQIKFLQEGVLSMTDSRIFVSSAVVKDKGKEIKLLFPDNYIFP
jgi:ArsR family metal-binding transcriptional regulator